MVMTPGSKCQELEVPEEQAENRIHPDGKPGGELKQTLPRLHKAAIPNLSGTRDQFHGRQFPMDWVGWGDGFGMIPAHCLLCALYFCYYYYISSTSDHQALDPEAGHP